jgi:serine/threonine protein kinase
VAAKDPLPGYELLEVLGEGGMATVFKARQRATGRVCALKVLRDFDAPEDRKERRLERFVREAALIERLDHPNVVRMITSGQDGGGAWMALDYVDGPSLEELLTREGGPLAVPVVLGIMTEVARALDHLKSRRVVHRDLKPANIVITTGGGIRLLDFGIATTLDEGSSDDRPILNQELPIGTIDYMAPEQVEEDERIDERVDLFALGSTAYRCLAGMTPFTGETVFARLRELVEREPPPLPRNLPPSLAALVLSLLSKKPAGRPSAAEVEKTCERLAAVAGFKGDGWTRRALTDALSKPRPPRVEPGLALVILSSEEITIERPLKVGEGFIIGRSLQDGVASTSIGRAWISRHHARVELGERGLVVTDLGSANGTFVNNLRLAANTDALVKPGDKLTLGKTTLTVALENAPQDLMAPAWKCLLCGVELPRDAGSTDDATGVEERHLCARCRSRMEEDRNSAEKRAREAIASLGGTVVKRIEIGGPILRFEVESQDKRKLAAHALDLGPSAAGLYVERSKAAMTLDHPGILKARAVMAASGVLVIVTDPVTTRTAAETILREGPLTPEAARRATITLAKACAHARSRGVTAIALRPQLVLLSKRGEPQLLDAGLAPALVEAGRSRVELGRSIPTYDAPESLGVRENTTGAVVYSLAACAHFFLTGEAPVELRSAGRRVSQPALATRPEIPPPLAQILDRALELDPGKRPAGPEELASLLESLAPRDVGSRESTPAMGRKRKLAVTQEITAATLHDSDDPDSDDTEGGGTMVLRLPGRGLPPLPPALQRLPAITPKPAPQAAPGPPQPGRVDLAGRLERLALERASGVLSIHGARARGRIELGAGKIVRVAAPQNLALDALAAVLAARDAATTFEPGAKLEPTSARVDITVADALVRARGSGS